MVNSKRRTAVLFVFITALFQAFNLNAVELGAFGDRIFSFQKKLALKGNTLAQYKLGTLYEFGVSVEPNIKEASIWYNKAANKSYVPAINRLTFLEIKQKGYVPAKHDTWFKGLITQIEKEEPNALILYGEMHRDGIKVKKNLDKALVFLEKASSYGHTEIDSEIDAIYVQIENRDQQAESSKQSKAEKKSKKKPAKKTAKKQAKKSDKKVAKKSSKKKKKDDKANQANIKEAKRLKYEKAMLQLRREAVLMQEQQQWSESDEDEEVE